MSFYSLGIHEAHDASCCLMKDGEVLAACAKERFSGLKVDYGISKEAMDYCLNFAGITSQDLNEVILCSKNWNPVLTKVKRNANYSVQDFVLEQTDYWGPTLLENKKVKYYDLFKDRKEFIYDEDYEWDDKVLNGYMDKIEMKEMRSIRQRAVSKMLGISEDKITFLTHELCHQYYGLYGSGMNNDDCLVLIAEGIGDYSNGNVALFQKDRKVLYQLSSTDQNNIGRIYQFITLLLGMKIGQHEYKTMGLAPYAPEYLVDKAYNKIKDILKVDGLNIIFDKKPNDLYFHFKEVFHGHTFDAIAGAVQRFTENLLVEWVRNCMRETEVYKICFVGGVSQNIKACKVISEIPELEDIQILPASGDASLSIGAAYYSCIKNGIKTEPLSNIYLGPEPTGYEIEKEIRYYKDYNCKFTIYECFSVKGIANLLKQNKIVARCSGRMEFGHRALGNRSIMANPKDISIVRRLNQAIKFRTWFMPFTPTICDYKKKDYIKNPKNLNAKFMTMAFDSTKKAQEEIPATLHQADLTLRPQILKREDNENYYDIVDAMGGCLLNTSLNTHGMPIVLGAKEAMHTFFNSGLDALILGDLLLIKE